MEKIKLTQGELVKLQQLQEQRQAYTLELGNIRVTELETKYRTQELEVGFEKLLLEEVKIGTELSSKYGNGTVDLEKGEFTPN